MYVHVSVQRCVHVSVQRYVHVSVQRYVHVGACRDQKREVGPWSGTHGQL